MIRIALPAVLLLFVPVFAIAQTQSLAGSQSSLTAPRSPGGVTAGTSTAGGADQNRMNGVVGRTSAKLLRQEKDRPRLPGQAPSPSQTEPGGTAAATPR